MCVSKGYLQWVKMKLFDAKNRALQYRKIVPLSQKVVLPLLAPILCTHLHTDHIGMCSKWIYVPSTYLPTSTLCFFCTCKHCMYVYIPSFHRLFYRYSATKRADHAKNSNKFYSLIWEKAEFFLQYIKRYSGKNCVSWKTYLHKRLRIVIYFV